MFRRPTFISVIAASLCWSISGVSAQTICSGPCQPGSERALYVAPPSNGSSGFSNPIVWGDVTYSTSAFPLVGTIPGIGVGSKGHSTSLSGGADVFYGSTLLLGAGFSHSDSKFANAATALSGATQTDSTSDVAFVRGVYYFQQIYNLSLTLGHGNVDSASSTSTASIPAVTRSDGHTSYIQVGFGATIRDGAWIVSPGVTVMQSRTSSAQHDLTFGRVLPKSEDTLGRVTIGPEVGYEIKLGANSTLTPHLRVQGVWDYDPSMSNRDRSAMDVGAGMSLTMGSLTMRGEYIGTYFREPQDGHGGRLTATYRF